MPSEMTDAYGPGYYTHSPVASGGAAPVGVSGAAADTAVRFERRLALAMKLMPLLRPFIHDVLQGSRRWVPDSAISVIDVGSGGGQFVDRMHREGIAVAAIEPDVHAAVHRNERLSGRVWTSVASAAESGGRWHVALLHHVAEHLEDPVGELRSVGSLLLPGGTLTVVTPNALGLGRTIFGRFFRDLDPPRHTHVFSRSSLEAVLRAAGYVDVQVRTSARHARHAVVDAISIAATGLIGRCPRVVAALVGTVYGAVAAFAWQLARETGDELVATARWPDGR